MKKKFPIFFFPQHLQSRFIRIQNNSFFVLDDQEKSLQQLQQQQMFDQERFGIHWSKCCGCHEVLFRHPVKIML
jgi:hypothetical protein